MDVDIDIDVLYLSICDMNCREYGGVIGECSNITRYGSMIIPMTDSVNDAGSEGGRYGSPTESPPPPRVREVDRVSVPQRGGGTLPPPSF